ncbi:hypothetical protein [Mucilaginibacter xinganensis]|uniref:Uncharacterized protein n=1 Tax=Mucilaginibacter xinganensis TaxID=1234841 RepID=A0A223NX74_9SPHI|nr:hypothetical protein [Mucilaginibacter xinganensis]ASU34426.1 hypothetical protein MuYL_2539 [Mucilaginibacter xinganensis]
MKKSIIIIALTSISTLSFAQIKPAKQKLASVAPRADQSAPTDTFKFTYKEAQLLFQLLEEDKKFYSLSDDISGRKANTIYIPRADSIQRILARQAKTFEDKRQLATKLKAIADSAKKATIKKP